MVDLERDVKYVKGVGPNRVQLLNKLGIFTLKDLITYYPRDYQDRSKPKNLYECFDGEEATVEVVATSRLVDTRIKNKRTMQRLKVQDETATATITWFNQSYLKNKFEIGKKYRFYGKVSNKYGRIEMTSPVFDEIEKKNNTGKIIPIYPLTFSLTQNTIRKIIENGLEIVKKEGGLRETLPQYLLEKYKLQDINGATEKIHFPSDFSEFKKARNRLVFEELLSTQLALFQLKNKNMTEHKGIKFDSNVHMSDVINSLPFNLTKAQLRVLEEIDNNMESDKSMNRLLQGDVGSGKTVVAMIAAYKTVKSRISSSNISTYGNTCKSAFSKF